MNYVGRYKELFKLYPFSYMSPYCILKVTHSTHLLCAFQQASQHNLASPSWSYTGFTALFSQHTHFSLPRILHYMIAGNIHLVFSKS